MEQGKVSQWNFVYLFVLLGGVFILLGSTLINLQIVDSADYKARANSNHIKLRYEYPNRGVIYDRNGVKLAENVPATNLVLELDDYTSGIELEDEKIEMISTEIVNVIGDHWNDASNESSPYESLSHMIKVQFEEQTKVTESGYVGIPTELLIASDLDNDTTIRLKSLANEFTGLRIEEGSKRKYTGGAEFAHIIGYTSLIIAEDIDSLDYLDYQQLLASNGYRDMVGRLGVERVYDEELIGRKGVFAVETDAYGNIVSDVDRELEPVVQGENLYLSIDSQAQKKMYELLVKSIEEIGATGGAGIIQDVNTGELIVLASAPSYDNNQFVGGISNDNYKTLLENPQLPLLNRPISAQLPPGSTFKTIGAIAGLDADAIDINTIYESKRGYTFSNGAPFQEFRNNEYGRLNVVDGISISSNIFFCEMIRNWDIDELVPYYEKFGIGSVTGIDLVGEASGRIPSPENKIELANTPGITWLDPVWYPEGDGCNTVIGQGTALVTPIQMSNWIAAIANGGTLMTPHLGVGYSNDPDDLNMFEFKIKNAEIVNKHSSIEIIQKAMRQTVTGPLQSIWILDGAKIDVAAKTGTAEFGVVNSEGIYEHTHAWVTGFFPYEDPQYSFVVMLEDGGQSTNAATIAREFIDWWAENMEVN
jgi:penicillin-binding protein 2